MLQLINYFKFLPLGIFQVRHFSCQQLFEKQVEIHLHWTIKCASSIIKFCKKPFSAHRINEGRKLDVSLRRSK